jgi:glyoxylase-like metal-dependent hydrolase (beta-lactamase superfamily II)
MPLPMSLNHINLWGLGTQDNLTLVDTGMHLDDTKNAWVNLIDSENLSIKDVVVTHMHPDHIGMAGWFVKKYNTTFSMSRTDYLQCRMLSADTGDSVPHDAIDFYTQAGMTEEQIKSLQRDLVFLVLSFIPYPNHTID